jgi:hypothetical protein
VRRLQVPTMSGLILAALLFVAMAQTYIIAAHPWDYRAVYHMDCASFMTES